MNKVRFVTLARSLGIFVFGMLVGAIVYARLCDYVLPAHIDRSFRAMYMLTESEKAIRAELNGDNLRAMVHSWNAADAASVHWYRYSETCCTDSFTFRSLVTSWLVSFPSNDEDRGEAMARGKLALLLEKNGFYDRAQHEWALTEKLMMFLDDVPDKALKTKQSVQLTHEHILSRARLNPETYFTVLGAINAQSSGGYTQKSFRYPSRFASQENNGPEYSGLVSVKSDGRIIDRNTKQIEISVKDSHGSVVLSDSISFDAAAVYVQAIWSTPDTFTIQLLDRGTAKDVTMYSEEDEPHMLAVLQYGYNAEQKVFERVN